MILFLGDTLPKRDRVVESQGEWVNKNLFFLDLSIITHKNKYGALHMEHFTGANPGQISDPAGHCCFFSQNIVLLPFLPDKWKLLEGWGIEIPASPLYLLFSCHISQWTIGRHFLGQNGLLRDLIVIPAI